MRGQTPDRLVLDIGSVLIRLIAQGQGCYGVEYRRRNAGETRFADPDPKGEAMETPRARLPPSASQGPGGIHEIEDMGIRRQCTDAG
jgi:hypothetical protein